MMSSQRAGDLGWRATDANCDLAVQVQAGEVVIVLFGDAQAVSDENEWGLHFGIEIDARAEESVFAKGQRLEFAVADESETGVFLDNLPRLELHRLVKAVRPRRLQSGLLQLRNDIVLGLA